MNRETMTKVFSTILSLALMISSVPMPAAAAGPVGPAFAAALTPPERFGYVASSFAPNGEDKPRLIVISDLHGHLDVQRNIMAMLDHFVNTLTSDASASAQSHVPIFVEGGWEPHLEQPLKAVQDKAVRAQLARYLLEKAELAAAQTYSELHLDSSKVTLTGVENKDEYEANRQRFAQTYPERKKLLEALARQEKTLQTLRENVQGGAYQKLYALRQDYDNGIVSQDRYAKTLVGFARRFGIENDNVATLRNISAASSSDTELALAQVYQAVAQHFSTVRPVRSYLRPSLPKEDQIRQNIGYLDSRLDLLKRLLGNQLTPEEVSFALSKMPELVQVAEILLKDSDEHIDVRQTVQKSLDFYPFAFMRDESLTQNSLAALKNDPQHVPTGILVAGGFHADGITKMLREQRIAYLLISPVVSRDITAAEQLNYIRRICSDHVTPMEVGYDMTHGASARLADAAPISTPVTNLAGQASPAVPNATDLGDTLKNPPKGGTKDYGMVGGFNPGMFAGDIARVTHDANDPAFIAGDKILAQLGSAGSEASAELTALAQKNDIQFQTVAAKSITLDYINGNYVAREVSSEAQGLERKANELLDTNGNASTARTIKIQAVQGTIDTRYKSNPNQKDFLTYSRQATTIEGEEGVTTVLLNEAIYDDAAKGTTPVTAGEIRRNQIARHELEHVRSGANEFITTLKGFAASAVIQDASKQGVDPTKVAHQASLESVKSFLRTIAGDRTEAGNLAGQLADALENVGTPSDQLYTAPELANLFARMVQAPNIDEKEVQKYATEFGLPEATVYAMMASDFEVRVLGYPAPSGFRARLQAIVDALKKFGNQS